MSSQIVASKYDATMTESRSVLPPNDIVSMPPLSVERYSNICAGSTNGTASDATYSDAVIQSCLEIIERDAYWFYMRTDVKPVEIPDYAYPPYLKNLIEKNSSITYIVELLPSPFRIPVVQVLAIDKETGIISRGTGAHFTINAAANRAFNECNQMLVSLRTGIDVSPTPMHMRNLWYSGKALDTFENIFHPSKNLVMNCI